MRAFATSRLNNWLRCCSRNTWLHYGDASVRHACNTFTSRRRRALTHWENRKSRVPRKRRGPEDPENFEIPRPPSRILGPKLCPHKLAQGHTYASPAVLVRLAKSYLLPSTRNQGARYVGYTSASIYRAELCKDAITRNTCYRCYRESESESEGERKRESHRPRLTRFR